MSQRKIKYEKPVALDMGALASVHGNPDCNSGSGDGATCQTGNAAGGPCQTGNKPHPGQCYSVGNDPDVAPVCQSGDLATFNCSVGDENISGNCSNGGTANGNCASNGGTASGDCLTGSTP